MKIGFIDFQGLWEGRETALSFSTLSIRPALCAVHVRQFEGASPLANLMEVKD